MAGVRILLLGYHLPSGHSAGSPVDKPRLRVLPGASHSDLSGFRQYRPGSVLISPAAALPAAAPSLARLRGLRLTAPAHFRESCHAVIRVLGRLPRLDAAGRLPG